MVKRVVDDSCCDRCGQKLEGDALKRVEYQRASEYLFRAQAEVIAQTRNECPMEGDRFAVGGPLATLDVTFRDGYWHDTATGELIGGELLAEHEQRWGRSGDEVT